MEKAMGTHRRFKQASLEERLAEEGQRLREQAKNLPRGADREKLLRKARQNESGAQLTEWITSPGLQPPEVMSPPIGGQLRNQCVLLNISLP
jgi:hypothetical protein